MAAEFPRNLPSQTARDQLTLLIEQCPLSIQIFSPEGRTIRVNSAFERMWGVGVKELEGYNVLFDPQLTSLGLLQYIQKAFAGGIAKIPLSRYLMQVGPNAGKSMWVAATIYGVKDDTGRVSQVVLIHQDVTDQIEVERQLLATEQRFNAIFDNSPDAILLVNGEGRCIDANRAAQVLTGYSRQELLELAITILVPESFEPSFAQNWAALLRGETREGTIPLQPKDGPLVRTEFRAVPRISPELHLVILRPSSKGE